MVRIPAKRKHPSPITRLQLVIEAGLTTVFAIGVATGISEKEIALLIYGEVDPLPEQEMRLKALLENYKSAIKMINAETLKDRID